MSTVSQFVTRSYCVITEPNIRQIMISGSLVTLIYNAQGPGEIPTKAPPTDAPNAGVGS